MENMENLIFSLIVSCSRIKGYNIKFAYLKRFERMPCIFSKYLVSRTAGWNYFLFQGNCRAKKDDAVFLEDTSIIFTLKYLVPLYIKWP